MQALIAAGTPFVTLKLAFSGSDCFFGAVGEKCTLPPSIVPFPLFPIFNLVSFTSCTWFMSAPEISSALIALFNSQGVRLTWWKIKRYKNVQQ